MTGSAEPVACELIRVTTSVSRLRRAPDVLLVKSPFSSFRIPLIEQHWGTAASYIHIVRDQHETAESMRRAGPEGLRERSVRRSRRRSGSAGLLNNATFE